MLLKESSTGQLQLFNCGGHSPESFSNISELESSTDYLLEFEMSPKRKEIILRDSKFASKIRMSSLSIRPPSQRGTISSFNGKTQLLDTPLHSVTTAPYCHLSVSHWMRHIRATFLEQMLGIFLGEVVHR